MLKIGSHWVCCIGSQLFRRGLAIHEVGSGFIWSTSFSANRNPGADLLTVEARVKGRSDGAMARLQAAACAGRNRRAYVAAP